MDGKAATSDSGRDALSALHDLDVDAEIRDLLAALWAHAPQATDDPVAIASTLRQRLGEPRGFEASRVVVARAALDRWLGRRKPTAALLKQAASGERSFALTFGGQASPYIDELALLVRRSPAAAKIVHAVADRLRHLVDALPASDRAFYVHGMDPLRWLEDPSSRPSTMYLMSSPVSQALILAAQVGHFVALLEAGFDRPEFWENVRAASGHSQGVMAATLFSENWGKTDLADRAADFAGYQMFQGLREQQPASLGRPDPELVASARAAGAGEPAPLAAVQGLSTEEIEHTIRKLGLPVVIGLDNGRVRKVLSGRPSDLEPLRRALVDEAEARKQARARGRHAGAMPVPSWQYLPVTTPFHGPWMASALEVFVEDLRRLGFHVRSSDLRIPVLDTDTIAPMVGDDIAPRLAELQFTAPVRWGRVVDGLRATGANVFLDFGPGDTVFRLTAANLKGHGVATLGIALDEHRAAALDRHVAPPLPVGWGHQENRWTRWTGTPPVFLPGMTPTTVETPIVAAAANGGFVAELAGGGQVTESVFRRRVQELEASLLPGRGVVLNALYLDPYLWKLQVGDGLLFRLRDEGAPLIGLTISAGVPPVDEAVELLRELHAHGLWLNAFKPGTDSQIKQVLAIADAAPELTFAAHVEGGRAGGHHSWEDLTDLVSRHYEQLRSRKNLVLAVGGGIATPEQAATWLDGSWSVSLGLAPMPVDAVFLGTVTMAVAEAKTSPQVKAALAACPGFAGPVLEGGCAGGVRSGRSHLDADIHYLDNSASRCGKLLDEIARAPATVDARKEEIVAALARTAKPWFGELIGRDWSSVLRRYVVLTAVDGPDRTRPAWLDVTHRERLAELIRIAEARFVDRSTDSFLQDPADLDAPEAFLDRFDERWPAARTTLLHPDDVRRFLEVCRRPGKPVPFVPVIDGDVRRWFKSDSLWQSHDDRYDADAVLIIPGPEAVAGILTVDEPVADLLARYTPTHTRPTVDPLRALLFTRDVALPGGRLGRNPALRLFDASRGTIRWERDASGPTAVVALDRDGRRMAEARREPLGVVVFAPDGRALDLRLSLVDGRPSWDRDAFREGHRRFWGVGDVAEPFTTAIAREPVTRERISTFLLATLDDSRGLVETGEGATVPLSMTFSLAWKAIFRVLGGVDPDLVDLVHEDHGTRTGPGWPIREGDPIDVVARVVSVSGVSGGRRIVVGAELFRGHVLCADVRTSFFVRGQTTRSSDVREPLHTAIWLADEAARDLLCAQPWFKVVGELPLGRRLTVACSRHTVRDGVFESTGVVRDRDRVVGRIALEPVAGPLEHPVAATCRLLAAPPVERPLNPIRDFGALPVTAPADLVAYAAASGDDNPIHLVDVIARLAGHPGCIVHGMWTASAAAHRALQVAAGGDGTRLAELSVRFLAVVLPGDALSVSVRQVAMREGHRLLEVDVTTTRGDTTLTVLSGSVRLRPPRTAYVFPGQGLQTQGMGMAGYARSAGARRIWDEADAACRSGLGFSLLQVVRENPGRLLVDGEILQHPNGVLHITRFTQVALVVLALAQVEELKEQQALVSDAWFCGHSLGEHSALGVFVRGLPLAGLVDVVYHRGKAMDRLVERDDTGRSPFAMGAVRPHHAGLDETAMRAMVARIAQETGQPLEVVNLNVRGRQYSVTGHVTALRRLQTELEALSARRPGSKPPFVEVAGVDMPFHSSVLLPGVQMMRATLQRTWPETIDPEEVVGRYVPNLTAQPFRLDRDYVEALVALTGTTELDVVLADWKTWRAAPGLLARAVLVELLAWQFAMPVRWIETQDVLVHETTGVEEIVEIGLAEQPILSGMVSQTLSLTPYRPRRPRVLHVESHRDELFGPLGGRPPEPAPAAAEPEGKAPTVAVAAAAPAPIALGAVADAPVSVLEGVQVLLALQTKCRVDQLGTETLDELLGGNSARRNQVLADLGAEFGTSLPDGAQELPLPELAKQIEKRAAGWRAPGRYLGAAVDQALGRALGAARMDRAAVVAHLEKAWGLGPGRATSVLLRVVLWARDGASGRGGALSAAPPKVSDRASGERWLDTVVEGWGAETGVQLRASAGGGAAVAVVDSGALSALRDELVGQDGLLTRAGRVLSGHDPAAAGIPSPATDEAGRRLAAFEKEHGAEYEASLAPKFDARRHVAFTSAWAWSRRDLFETRDPAAVGRRLDQDGRRMAAALGLDPEVDHPRTRVQPTAPRNELGDEGWRVREVPRPGEPTLKATLARLDGLHPTVRACLERWCEDGGDFHGRTALVTGASPGSIALEVVSALLEGGARVVLTTTNTDPARIATYKKLYQERAVPGAELHVVPFNQGCFADVDALLDWLGSGLDDVPCVPDLLVPFAASSEIGHLDPGGRSLATLRVLLLGVERLIVAVARAAKTWSVRDRRCHVLLPWSPNHGTIGGDGAYGESKAALETLVNRWRSEQAAWGSRISLVGVRIGWVRGTGLMSANDLLAERLEADCGVRTFSTVEMGQLLVGLLGEELRLAAADAPVDADLGGGLDRVPDLSSQLGRIRAELGAAAQRHRRRRELEAQLRTLLSGPAKPVVQVHPRANPSVRAPVPSDADLRALPELDHLDPRHVVVVVGYGEVSPWGSARTRWAIERDGVLSIEAAAELAWMTGMVKPRPDGTGWTDVASGQSVEDVDLLTRYGERLMSSAGIRLIDPEVLGFDPERLTSALEVHLDRDFSFPVPTRQLAEDLRRADPEHTLVLPGPGEGFTVVRRSGAVLRLPRALRSDRQVCGQIPSGWDPRRYGIAPDLVLQVDRATLFGLVANAEAFLAAGLTPEEVLAHLHPTRVGSTQGNSMGGVSKLARMYRDLPDGRERQMDVLQEGLANVVVGYVVQSWLGSYGPMSFPAAACATSAVSVADAWEKILAGTADLVIAGGTEDFNQEISVSFADVGASASSDELMAKGIPASALSRPNDRRRGGFVEAHGAGVSVLCRASVAVEMGLPVYGIVAFAGSYADGLYRSVPAPGLGPLGSMAESGPAPTGAVDLVGRRRKLAELRSRRDALAAMLGGEEADRLIEAGVKHWGHDFWRSQPTIAPLRGALAVFGLGADDVGLISKHDTSTSANDPNENRLHQALQDKLGRTPGLPLPVVSQKSLTGHPKGAAAAWQLNGVLQAMADGVVPGNHHLDDVDPEMAQMPSLLFTDRALNVGPGALRAGLITSLGFGHVGGIVALAHPFLFWRMLDEGARRAYLARLSPRLARASTKLQAVLSGREPLFVARTRRPFDARDGTHAQTIEEIARLTDADWRPGAR